MHFMSLLLAGLTVMADADAQVLPHELDSQAKHQTPQALFQQVYMPQAKSSKILGNVTDPDVTRDSCGSVRLGFRTLWTCRDTSLRIPDTDQYGFVFVNTVGWTDQNSDGSPAFQLGGPIGAGSDGSNSILLMTGPRPSLPAFYPLGPEMCSLSGRCSEDDTRWTGWPDSPPLVTSTASDGTITAYTWIQNQHMSIASFEVLTRQPSTTLYKLTYSPNLDPNILPNVTIIDTAFWMEHEIGFGVYGNVVNDSYAYVYGLTESRAVALARVTVDNIEDRSQYQYYVNGTWTKNMPAINGSAAAVHNAGTSGQGNFYYSERHRSYVWIGQPYPSIWADFHITTAPSPEGPWIDPYLLYQGPNGDGEIPAYSLQAHPHLLSGSDDGIYLTWTQFHKASTNPALYLTPLAYVSFV